MYSDKLGVLEIYDSILKSEEGLTILSGKLKLKIKDQDFFYKNFLIPKSNRIKIKNLIFDVSLQLNNRSLKINNVFFEDNNKIRNFDSIDQIIENNKLIKYDYLNSILFRKFIKEIIVAYSYVG